MALFVSNSWEPNFSKPTPSNPIKLKRYKNVLYAKNKMTEK